MPLAKIAGGAPRLGAKMPAVSLYFGTSSPDAWTDFNPVIAACACSDSSLLKRALDSINLNDWKILEQAMKTLNPTQLGLHHLRA